MERKYIEEKVFDKADLTKEVLIKGDYESCSFIGCDLSNTDLSEIILLIAHSMVAT